MSAAAFKPKVLAVLIAGALIAACAELEEEMIIIEPVMEEPGVSVPAAPVVTPAARAGRGLSVRRGTVTAGDIDDTLNLAAFNRFAARASRTHDLPALDLTAPIRFRLTGPAGRGCPLLPGDFGGRWCSRSCILKAQADRPNFACSKVDERL